MHRLVFSDHELETLILAVMFARDVAADIGNKTEAEEKGRLLARLTTLGAATPARSGYNPLTPRFLPHDMPSVNGRVLVGINQDDETAAEPRTDDDFGDCFDGDFGEE